MQYPDTERGVIEMLDSTFDIDFDGCTAEPDPQVQGVWLVRSKSGGKCIAYLAGYPDPNGNLRQHNDAEFSDEGWYYKPLPESL